MNFKSVTDCFDLGNGVKIPCIGFGTWQTPDGETTTRVVKAALQCGYRHIDCAPVYRNEVSVGAGIKESGVPRKDIFITSKVPNTHHGYEETKEAFEKTIKDLACDYLDLYLIHWPNPQRTRDHWQEANAGTWKAMEEMVKAGKVRAIGLSNFRAHHIDEILKTAEIKPVANQIRLCPGDAKAELVKESRDRGLQLEAYSPLGGTVGGARGASVLQAPVVLDIAKKYGKSAAQICVRWCLELGFLPLPKSTSPEHIASNAAVFDFQLSAADVDALSNMPGYPDPFPHPDQTTY